MSVADGPSRLTAVSRIATSQGIGQVSALSATGVWPNLVYGDDQVGQIERLLDETTATVLSEVVDGPNVEFYREYTPDSGTGQIDFSSVDPTVLSVEGVGRFVGRKLTIRNGKLFDKVAASDDFSAEQVVTLKIGRNMPFEQLGPQFRAYVLARALLDSALTTRTNDPRIPFLVSEVNNRARMVAAAEQRSEIRPPVISVFDGATQGQQQ